LSEELQPADFHIFLSYRREDAGGRAGRLYDHLVPGEGQGGFAEDQVFMDIDTIPAGEDFRAVITDAVANCDVLLAVIGRHWTTVEDADGRRRLENPADFVRIEVEAAMQSRVPVVPVLVDDATMPNESELPESIAELAYRNAVELSDSRWRNDVSLLLTSLKKREEAASTGEVEPMPDNPGFSPVLGQNPILSWDAGRDSGDERTYEEEWDDFVSAHQPGDVVRGRVQFIWPQSCVIDFGAGVTGLLFGEQLPPRDPRIKGRSRKLTYTVVPDGRLITQDDVVTVTIQRVVAPEGESGYAILVSFVDLVSSSGDASTG